MVKQVSSSNDIKKNNVAFSTDVSATMYSHDFACENCNNSIVDKTHRKKHMKNYHKARMKETEEANNIMNSHKLTEEPEDRHTIYKQIQNLGGSIFTDLFKCNLCIYSKLPRDKIHRRLHIILKEFYAIHQ